MEFFEKVALNSTPIKPVMEDTFCIIKKRNRKHLLEHLNSVSPIKFTMESQDSMLPFLGCLIRERMMVCLLPLQIHYGSESTGQPQLLGDTSGPHLSG